jgi:hypothetical protein
MRPFEPSARSPFEPAARARAPAPAPRDGVARSPQPEPAPRARSPPPRRAPRRDRYCQRNVRDATKKQPTSHATRTAAHTYNGANAAPPTIT